MTFWEKIDRFPPALVRLLARKGPYGPALTTDELARSTGLPKMQIVTLSQQLNWSGVDLPTARLFMQACRVDLECATTLKRVNTYMRGKVRGGMEVPSAFRYLRRSPEWTILFLPAIESLHEWRTGFKQQQ